MAVLPLASMAAAMANLVMASLVTDLSLVTDHPREADTTAANHSTAADINRGKYYDMRQQNIPRAVQVSSFSPFL